MFYFPNRLNWSLSSIWNIRFNENCLIELWGFSRLGGVRCEDEEILSRAGVFKGVLGWHPTPSLEYPNTPFGRTPGLGARLFSWQRLGPHYAPEQEQDVWQSPLLQRLGPHKLRSRSKIAGSASVLTSLRSRSKSKSKIAGIIFIYRLWKSPVSGQL